jgi:PKHD-type hydroxylase
MWYLNSFKQEPWAFRNDVFNDIECQQIIEYGLSKQLKTAEIVQKDLNGASDFNIRNSTVSWFDAPNDARENWIHSRCAEVTRNINSMFFNYDLTFIQDLQFTVYRDIEKQYYSKHTDITISFAMPRKLSFSILLNSPEDYSGGDLLFHYGSNPDSVDQIRGRGIFFPSHTLHEVTPVTSGTRYALVGWCIGPPFK